MTTPTIAENRKGWTAGEKIRRSVALCLPGYRGEPKIGSETIMVLPYNGIAVVQLET